LKGYLTPLIKPLLFGLVTFIFVFSITLVIVYQQINFQKEKEKEELARELHHIKDRFRDILYSDITAANSLAIFYKQYGVTKDFDSIAAQIIRYNRYAEKLQITVNGIITKVYPIEGYEKTIGINTQVDSMRLQESKRAFEKNSIYFAGPRKLRGEGVGILGKVPIRNGSDSFAVSVVLTRIETVQKGLKSDIDSSGKYSYWLVKKSEKSDTSKYFLSKELPYDINEAIYTDIPEGDWNLGSAHSVYMPAKIPVSTLLLGGLLALMSSVLIYRNSSQPHKLKKIISEKTKELADQEKYYRTLIQTSSDAIVLLDSAGKILYQTPSTERIIGYTFEDMRLVDGLSLIHPDNRDQDNKKFSELMAKPGSELNTKHRLKHKLGHYIWIEGTYLNLLHDETIHAIVLTYSDITNRVTAEENELHAKYLLGERVKELSTIYKLNTVLQADAVHIDELFQRIVEILPGGWQFPELCSAKIEFDGIEYKSKTYKPSSFKQIAKINLEDGRSGSIEIVYSEKTQEEAEGPFLEEERALINTSAEMIQTYFNKKRAYDELVKSAANLKTVFNNGDIAYLLFDENKNILAYNQYFLEDYEKLTGITIEVDKNVIEKTVHENRNRFNEHIETVSKTHKSVIYESAFINDGLLKHYLITLSPVISNDRIIGYCMAAFNITQRKHMEDERQHLLEERLNMIDHLTRRNRDLEQFSYIVSHNIRAPLANILGLTNMMNDTGLDQASKEKILQGVQTSAKNLDTILFDLNEILQVRSEYAEKKSLVLLSENVEKTQELLTGMIRSNNVIIETDFVQIDSFHTTKSYISNIFYNLVNNSIKYARPDVRPHIKIWSEKTNDRIILHFKDNGLGFDLEKYGDSVFGLYKRFNLGVEGKGMGLFMVKKQVEALNGTIEIQSKPNEGAHFSITFNEIV
jgi:PAS domain S-box-containing protein